MYASTIIEVDDNDFDILSIQAHDSLVEAKLFLLSEIERMANDVAESGTVIVTFRKDGYDEPIAEIRALEDDGAVAGETRVKCLREEE